MTPPEAKSTDVLRPDSVDHAVDLFLRARAGSWSAADEAALDDHLQDAARAEVLRRVGRAWQAVGSYADSPEIMVLREQALARARRASVHRWNFPASVAQRRWLVAASVVLALALFGVTWQLSPYGLTPGAYRTEIGEQKMVELADRSTIAIDSNTRLRVRYSSDARTVEIAEGQAQFSVAEDLARPFKVIAGNHTIVALGTVFTVEYLDQEVHVAMLEGRVAVLTPPPSPSNPGPAAPRIELNVGEALRVDRDGRASVTPKADLAAATAWRQGQIVFHDEPLGDAIRRLNRYSRVQLQVKDPGLANLSISGLFEAGDTRAFANALQSYLPVTAQESDSDTIELRMR